MKIKVYKLTTLFGAIFYIICNEDKIYMVGNCALFLSFNNIAKKFNYLELKELNKDFYFNSKIFTIQLYKEYDALDEVKELFYEFLI